MIKHLSILAWFAWIVSALGQGQINLNNRGFALVNDSSGKPLTGTSFVAVVLYGASESTLSKSFAPSPFRASSTTYPGTWNPAGTGGPGTIATLSGFAPGSTVTMKVAVYDSAVFGSWSAASAALAAGKNTVPTQAGISSAFTYSIPADPLAIPGGMEKFPGLKLTALSNTGPVNQAPTAAGQTLSVNTGQTLSIVLAGSDPEGAALSYTVVASPVNGTLTGTGANRVYTPKSGYSGADSFTFKVNDGSLDSAVATVSITVKSVVVNQPPTALSQSQTVVTGQTLSLVLAGTDPEGASLSYSIVTLPVNGTVSGAWGGQPQASYTPKAGFTGVDSFTFKVNDGSLDSAVATVSITVKAAVVNQAPTADSQNVSVALGEAKTLTLTGKDPEGAALKYTVLTQPVSGTLAGTAPNLTYTPKSGFTGSDSFTFKVNDGSLDSAVATVSISVSQNGGQINLNNRGFALVNDATGKPLVGTVFAAKIFYGASESALSQSFNPAPFRDSTTAYPGTWNPGAAGGPGAIATLSGFNPGSTVTLKVAVWDTSVFATWELAEAALKAGKSTVPTQAGLSAAFTYTIPTDPLAIPGGMEKFPGLKLTALNTSGPANQAPTAAGQTLSVLAGQTLPVVLSGTDPEGAALSFTVVTLPANGTLTGNGANRIYAPKSGFTGADSFTFKVNDGTSDSALATVSITVKAVSANQPPVAQGQTLTTVAGKPLPIVLAGVDPEGKPVTFAVVTQPANGALSGTAPNLTYTPKSGFTGSDSLTFKVNDGALDSAVAIVSIAVNADGNNGQINLNNRGLAQVNDSTGKPLVGTTFVARIFYGASEGALNQSFAPAPFRDSTTAYPGTWNPGAAGGPGSIATLSGFAPGATVTLKVAVWDTAVFATWELAEAALKAGKNTVPTQVGLSAAFTYSIPTDPLAIPGGMEKFAGLKLTALGNSGPANQVPTAAGQALTVVSGQTLPIVLAGTDPEGAALTFTVVAPPANGTLTGTGANRIYTPRSGFTGADSFTFKVNDGSADSAVATVAITVKAASVVVTPPEFPVEPPPWDLAPCICGPLVGNYETNQIHTWHVLADGGPLDLQLTTVTVNTNDPQTTIVDAFDGTNRIATVTVSYTAAEARTNGLRWEKTASVNLGTFARGKVIRLESRIGGTPVTQTHYTLQFCGARWLAIDLPSFKALEEDHAAYRFNVKSGESLTLDLDNVGIPTPATAFRYRLINPLGVVVKAGTNAIVAGPELTVASPAVGLWTLEMRPIGGEHYLLDKTTGVDRHAYLDWYTSQRGVKEVQITVNGKPAIGVPFEVQLTRVREIGASDPGDVVVSAMITNSWARFVELPNGVYEVSVRPMIKEIAPIDSQRDWIYCNNPVTNLFAFTRLNKSPVFDAIANATIDEGKPFNLTLKASDPEGAPLGFSLVGGPAGLTVSASGALSWTPAEEQGPSTNVVGVAVSDGIDSVTNRFTLVVKEVNAAPAIAAVSRQTLDEGKALSLSLTATDADLPKQPLVFQLTSGPAGLTVSPAGQVTWVAGEDFGGKTETVKFSVSDGLQTVGAEFQVVVNEVNESPVVASVARQTLDEGKALALTLGATDADLPKQALVFRLVSGPAGLTLSQSGQVAWATGEESGGKTETVKFNVSDGLVVVPGEFQVVVNEINDAPVLSGVADQTVDVLKPLTIQLSAKDTDLPAQKLVFGLTSGPKGLSVSDAGLVEWTPAADQGGTTNRVEVFVTDGTAKVPGAFVLVVRPSNTAPTIADVAVRRVSENGNLVLNLAASDTDVPAQKLVFALVSGPDGLTVSEAGQVRFRPTETQGPSTNRVVVKVTDNGSPALSGTNAFNVIVLEINQAPELASVENQTVEALKPWGVRLSAKDADLPAQRLTFALVEGPVGMSIDPVEGLVSWTPSGEQASAKHPVTVSVSDGLRVVTRTFEIEVLSANKAPTFANLFNRTLRELNSLNFRLIGRDLDQPAQKLTYALVSGPKGLTVSTEGQLTWTPTEEQGPSTNVVTVAVADNGTPSMSTTNSFTIFVTEANNAPTFVNAFSRSILETAGLNFTLIARDTDLPAQKLTLTLVSGPKGLTMTDAGVISWSPTEDQGPSTNTIVVRVTDDASSPRSTTTNFVVTVREANAAPVFPVTNLTVAAASKLAVALKATDTDIPVQTLSYRLERGPAGLTVSTNGLLEWTPAAGLANTTNVVTVSVSDSVSRIQATFRVFVRPVGSGPGSETKSIQRTRISLLVQADQSLALRVVGPEGGRFRVESTTLLGVEWQTEDAIGEIETLGEDVPVIVPIPAEGSGEFRQFRLKKQ